MDELKKNGFWIVCGLLTLMMVGSWWWASSSARALQLANESAIETAAKNAMEVKNKTFDGSPPDVKVHPTPASELGMKKQISETTRKMLEAWELRRTAQTPILKWPVEVLASAEFAQKFSKFDPPHKFKLKGPDGQESIPTFENLMQIYKSLIPKRMNEIAKIIDIDWKPIVVETSKSFEPKNKGEKERPKFDVAGGEDLNVIVKWDEKNKQLWIDKLTSFRGMDGNLQADDVPLPRQVFALQEDLWLLEAFFNIVKSINGDAKTNEMAPIKEIIHVAFGRESYQTQIGKIMEPNQKLLAGRIVGDSGEESSEPSNRMLSKEEREDRAAAAQAGATSGAIGGGFNFDLTGDDALLAPFHGRYVNANFEPLDIKDIFGVFESTTLPENNVEAIVARRIPFRIAVRMSESKIPNLIAGFSNSDFQFEVFQVRINREDFNPIERKGAVKDKGIAGGRDRPAVGVGGGAGGASGFDGGGGGTDAGPKSAQVDRASIEIRTKDDVTVEFYGIVKIYNPVDWARFKDYLYEMDAAMTTAAR